MNTKIETQRLILRPVTLDDTQDFFEMDSNPKVHIYLGNKPVTSYEQSEEMVQNILNQYKNFGIGRLAMIKKNTNEFVGWSGLKYEREVRKEFNYYDLGYRLKEQFWGIGYATEAALASLDYGFNDLKLDKICAAAEHHHVASNRILQNIGMQLYGSFKFDSVDCNWYVMENRFQ